jgi:hypothetical protein
MQPVYPGLMEAFTEDHEVGCQRKRYNNNRQVIVLVVTSGSFNLLPQCQYCVVVYTNVADDFGIAPGTFMSSRSWFLHSVTV